MYSYVRVLVRRLREKKEEPNEHTKKKEDNIKDNHNIKHQRHDDLNNDGYKRAIT